MPNFEIYYGNENLNQDRVQIKMVKDFLTKSDHFQKNVLLQIKNTQIIYNNCSGQAVSKLIDYVTKSNNLYIVSETHDCNLIDILPLLLRANSDNEFVSILIIYDLLKIIKNLYK